MRVVLLLIVILVSIWLGVYGLAKQQGRILARLEQLEQQRANGGQESEPGLAVGAVFPSFSLPDRTGKIVRLEDFRGKQVLVVHWSPQCGFCRQIAPKLAQLQPAFAARRVQLVLIASGEAEPNRELAAEFGLHCPILLKGGNPPKPFADMGTPVAYLLDAEGRVAKPLAVGADGVPVLAQEAAGTKTENQLPANPQTKRGDSQAHQTLPPPA